MFLLRSCKSNETEYKYGLLLHIFQIFFNVYKSQRDCIIYPNKKMKCSQKKRLLHLFFSQIFYMFFILTVTSHSIFNVWVIVDARVINSVFISSKSIIHLTLKQFSRSTAYLTLFRMRLFGAANRCGQGKKAPLLKICHTYPTTMKFGTVIPCLRKV